MKSPIVMSGLTKYFGSNPAIVNLDLEVKSGRFVGYLGPNGAGKSTTIKLLCGLLSPDSGEVYLNGVDVSENPQMALKSVGVIMETTNFHTFLTPREQLEYFGRLRDVRKDELSGRIEEVLDIVGLSEHIDVRIEEFSRGMRQRLGIAQCILHDPEVLLLDEPLLALDPKGVSEMRDFLNRLKDEGKTVLYSSHILSEVQQVCEEVAILREGRILTHKKMEDLEDAFRIKEVEVETLEPLEPSQLKGLREMECIKDLNLRKETVRIRYSGGKEERAKILEQIRASGGRISSFKKRKDLEDLYMKLEEDSLG